MYAPPPDGYAWMVCRYESVRIPSRIASPTTIGTRYWNAIAPAARRTSKIASVEYATDEMASDEKTASAVFLSSRSLCACADPLVALRHD